MSETPIESTLRYRFHTREIGDFDIHFRTLRDRQQFEDIDQEAENLGVSPASWPLFGVVWQAGEVLAQLMAEYEIGNKRILEVGCGVALASLVLNKRGADISATDYHPSAERYLDFNTTLNGDAKIPFLRTAWEDLPDQGFGLFDLIIASDVMFEPDHTDKLVAFIELYAQPQCEVLLADAGRGYGNRFTRGMAGLGYNNEQLTSIAPFTNAADFKGKIQRYRRGAQP